MTFMDLPVILYALDKGVTTFRLFSLETDFKSSKETKAYPLNTVI